VDLTEEERGKILKNVGELKRLNIRKMDKGVKGSNAKNVIVKNKR
jgi:hypothetical protein